MNRLNEARREGANLLPESSEPIGLVPVILAQMKPGVHLLVFRLELREYALPITQVVEVLRMVAIAPVPEAPVWLPGVINLRGHITPVIDLRTRLGLARRQPGLNTPIIISRLRDASLGLIADEVSDVIDIPSSLLEKVNRVDGSAPPLSAIAHMDARLIMILDLPRLCAGLENLVSA